MQKPLLAHLLAMRFAFLLPLAYGLVSSLPVRAQTHPALVGADNSAWLDSVQQLPLAQQVAAVQGRAWRDTLLAPYQMPACWLGVSAATRSAAVTAGQRTPAKPSGFPLLYVIDGQPFYNHDAATIRQFQQRVLSWPIRQVTVLRQTSATAIYGSRAANGVVQLTSTKAKHRP